MKRLAFLLCLLVLTGTVALAGADTDPMIKITTLPCDFDKQAALAKISPDVSAATGIGEDYITYYWQTFDAIHCPGCAKAGVTSPVFVEIYGPGFLTATEKEALMNALADAIDAHTPLARNDIFIHLHIAEKGESFLGGKVLKDWDMFGK